MIRCCRVGCRYLFALPIVCAFVAAAGAQQQDTSTSSTASPSPRAFVTQYCVECHNSDETNGGLDLDALSLVDISSNADAWESVIRKLRVRQMPPSDMPRPDQGTYESILAQLESVLDQAALDHPNPGRSPGIRRLTRTEYQNAIRDLLHLNIDVSGLLPADESSHGFDNVTVGDLSPTLLERYLTAAEKISRLAVGISGSSPGGDTFRIRPDITQEEHVEGLPLGTRGGAMIAYNFPQDGDYEVQIRLARDRNEEVEGLTEGHELEVLLDDTQVESFTVAPPVPGEGFDDVDQKLKLRFPVTAGPHQLGVTFLKTPSSLLETKRQPYQAHYNMHRHPRISPAIYQISITGPYSGTNNADTPSRRKIFVSEPKSASEEETCAQAIVATLARQAYRRPTTEADLVKPMELFHQARAEGDFDAGIQMALSAILVNPNFLFRIERNPSDVPVNTAYRISDVELASRLSFFLWSSIPDEELLQLASRAELSQPDNLAQQVERMLADPRSHSLVNNFADQWLHLRNLDSITPDLRLFPDFDDNLRQAFRRETELLFKSILQNDRSVLELLAADVTFLNERLAKHYGIPHVYGSRFRRVSLPQNSLRGGLLRHGSVLTVTSYATRTSPVIRGKWVLENLIGTPPPPQPGNVPALKDNTVSSTLSVRERLAEHRAHAECASCHNLMDPVGLALENFDAVGRWRILEEGEPIDATGGLPDGREFVGVSGLEQALLDEPQVFVGTFTEKLLTYALGRGLESGDAPAVRKIVKDAQANEYRLSTIISGIVSSAAFQMRISE